MFKLNSGNVLLKPSQRRQLVTWLRRSLRLGQRMRDFLLTISIRRIGRSYEVSVTCRDSAGRLHCRSRRHDWRDALRELARRLELWLHNQHLRLAAG
jgi:hypothetical protein